MVVHSRVSLRERATKAHRCEVCELRTGGEDIDGEIFLCRY